MRPIPKALHALHGNPSHKRLDSIEEPVTRGPLGPPPFWLGKGARQAWRELQESMPLGVLASADLPTVAGYCDSLALFREAVTQMRESGGAVVKNHDGDLVKSPWLFVRDRQFVLLMRAAEKLCLTPSARAAMGARLAAAGTDVVYPGGQRPRKAGSIFISNKTGSTGQRRRQRRRAPTRRRRPGVRLAWPAAWSARAGGEVHGWAVIVHPPGGER
jgi:P27 family predicted phage terminase small subunit